MVEREPREIKIEQRGDKELIKTIASIESKAACETVKDFLKEKRKEGFFCNNGFFSEI